MFLISGPSIHACPNAVPGPDAPDAQMPQMPSDAQMPGPRVVEEFSIAVALHGSIEKNRKTLGQGSWESQGFLGCSLRAAARPGPPDDEQLKHPGFRETRVQGDSVPVLDLAAGSLFLGSLAFFVEPSSHGAPSRTGCTSRTGTLHRASDQLCEPLSGVADVGLLAAAGLADHDQTSFGVETIVCLTPESSFDLRREDMASLEVEP